MVTVTTAHQMPSQVEGKSCVSPSLGWSPGRGAERVAGVDSPFAAGFGEHEARAFRVGESRCRRVAVDLEVERGVGRARQRVRVEARPALFQYLLALCASRTAGELVAGLGGVAVGECPEISDNGLTDLLLV